MTETLLGMGDERYTDFAELELRQQIDERLPNYRSMSDERNFTLGGEHFLSVLKLLYPDRIRILPPDFTA